MSYLQHVDSEVSRKGFCFTVNLHLRYSLWGNLGRMTSVVPAVSCRCVSCTQCGATTPGLRCEWQNNYTQCAPCASLATCPICLLDYSEGTIIVQCRQCDRYAVFLQYLSSGELFLTSLFFFFFFNIVGSYLNLLFYPQMVPCVLSGSPFRRRRRKSCRQ